jgi:hypothetical protein
MEITQVEAPKKSISDKVYWHGYIPFYETFFAGREFTRIAEFGVYKGNSIRWLLERFPNSKIFGADLFLTFQSEWPTDARFEFTQLDQGDPSQIADFLKQDQFDLIIEDGSHIPQHQINCLLAGLESLKSNGIYILEDIDTSLPGHVWWTSDMIRPRWWKFKKVKEYKKLKAQVEVGNAFHALISLQHFQRINVKVNDEIANKIAENSLLTKNQILFLSESIKQVHFYRRSHLPDWCHQCGSEIYNFSQLKCICGQEVFSNATSMSFVLIKR